MMEGIDVSVAMDKQEYDKGLAMSILPEGHNYNFKDIKVISDIDDYGEVKMEIMGRADVGSVDGVKKFLGEFCSSSGASFNIKSGKPDRSGKDSGLYGFSKCMMQVKRTNVDKPRRERLHQDCPADLKFRLDTPKVMLNYVSSFVYVGFLCVSLRS